MADKKTTRKPYAQVLMDEEAKIKFKIMAVQSGCKTMVRFFRRLSSFKTEEIIKLFEKK